MQGHAGRQAGMSRMRERRNSAHAGCLDSGKNCFSCKLIFCQANRDRSIHRRAKARVSRTAARGGRHVLLALLARMADTEADTHADADADADAGAAGYTTWTHHGRGRGRESGILTGRK